MAQPARVVIPDPNLTIGPYRILERTDRLWSVYDERRPAGYRDALIASSKAEAVAGAQELVAQGSPLESAPRSSRRRA